MKINLFLALFAASSLGAAPLATSTAVHSRPEAAAPTIATLNAGTEPKAAVGPALPLTSGWSAVELEGPHEAYVQNKDLQKNLDVRAGATFHTTPKAGSPVLTVMESGDQVEITGYHGRWTQVKLNKRIVGYIQGASGLASAASNPSTTPSSNSAPATAQKSAASVPFAQAPAAPAATATQGRPVSLGDGGSASLPRLFQGKFVSTRSLLRPRRPYDFQLNDTAGARYAYLDVSRLLQTEQIDKYVERTVAVYGTAKPVKGTNDIVIEVESLQLK